MNIELDKNESQTIPIRKDHVIWILLAVLILTVILSACRQYNYRKHYQYQGMYNPMMGANYRYELGKTRGTDTKKVPGEQATTTVPGEVAPESVLPTPN
jgi:hypothetical protein